MRSEEIESIIRWVIAKHLNQDEVLVFVFGSRAGGSARPSSDYDIGIYKGGKVPWVVLAAIKDELEDYPISVDIELVDFATVSKDFRDVALKEVRVLNTPKKDLKLI